VLKQRKENHKLNGNQKRKDKKELKEKEQGINLAFKKLCEMIVENEPVHRSLKYECRLIIELLMMYITGKLK
jgi:hypothetical protein